MARGDGRALPAPIRYRTGPPIRFGFSRRSRVIIGPLLTAAVLALIVALRSVAPISSPGLLLLLSVAISAVLGGIRPALVSAAITALFVLVDASTPGTLFQYTPDSISRLIVNLIVAPSMAILVGGIQHRLEVVQEREAERRSEERQRALTETATDSIITIDDHSRIVAVNPAASTMFGIPVNRLVGLSMTELMPTALRDQHLAAFHRYLETGERRINWHGTELTARHASGREFPVDVSFGEYMDGEERRFTGIIRDISRRKELEIRLQQAQKMEAVGQLAGGVAHDFNNMLTAITGFAELAAAQPEDTELRDTALDGIRQAADRAATLTRQLLAFSRKQHLEPAIINLNDVVLRVEPLLQRLLGENIELVTRDTPGLWPVLADPAQLETVVMNLAINARDAMPQGGRLTIETTNVDLDEAYSDRHFDVIPGPHAMLAVTDTGSGIDAMTMEHIFEPFYTTKGVGHGTGLGLATVYGVVKQSGGNIWVYSELGRGTTFKIYLPQAQGSTVTASVPATAAPLERGTETILVAEDEAVVRDLIVAILERQGYQVMTAEDGTAASRILEGDEHIDLLLTDVIMPGAGGPEIAARAATIRPRMPVVLISGYTANALPSDTLGLNQVLLEKPFTARQLADTIRRALDAPPLGLTEATVVH